VARRQLLMWNDAGAAELIWDLRLERVEVLAVAVIDFIPDGIPLATHDAVQSQRHVGVNIDTNEAFSRWPPAKLGEVKVEYRVPGTDGNRA